MIETRWLSPDWLIRWEPWLVLAVCIAGLTAIPLSLGHIGLSWDALNHHIYLGWVAQHPRFELDYLAASYQAYQYPYLYWPIYRLALAGASGMWAGVVMAQLHALAVPAVWRIARACMPGREWFDVAMRATGVGLAFMSGLILSMFDSTSNDLLSAIPLIWAIALALEPAASDRQLAALPRAVRLSAFLAGISVAFKFSNGPIAILLPVLWMWPRQRLGARIRLLLEGGMFAVLGFALAYGWWGWLLWTHLGNPVYPLFDGWFEPLRQAAGWVHGPF